jgi:hypothetical protein
MIEAAPLLLGLTGAVVALAAAILQDAVARSFVLSAAAGIMVASAILAFVL